MTFAAQMSTLSGASEMEIRVDLETKAGTDKHFHALSAPGLGVWHESEPSVKVFRYLAQVTNLAAPASYRALVSFRWLEVGGHVMRHLSRHTPPCRQDAPESPAGNGAPANMGGP